MSTLPTTVVRAAASEVDAAVAAEAGDTWAAEAAVAEVAAVAEEADAAVDVVEEEVSPSERVASRNSRATRLPSIRFCSAVPGPRISCYHQ